MEERRNVNKDRNTEEVRVEWKGKNYYGKGGERGM